MIAYNNDLESQERYIEHMNKFSSDDEENTGVCLSYAIAQDALLLTFMNRNSHSLKSIVRNAESLIP